MKDEARGPQLPKEMERWLAAWRRQQQAGEMLQDGGGKQRLALTPRRQLAGGMPQPVSERSLQQVGARRGMGSAAGQ